MTERKDLPRLERGKDLSRIFAFTDGVFAIAITLLVLQIEVPSGVESTSDLWKGLGDEFPNFVAFAISFLVIGNHWISTHRFMRTVVEYDRGLMSLTLLYLAFVVLIPFTSQMYGEYGSEVPMTIVIYIANLVLIACSTLLMQRHVLREKLGRPEYRWDTRLTMKSSQFTIAVFIGSIPFVFLLGPWTPVLWFGLRFDPYQRRRDGHYGERST